ncbi:general stress protein [Mesobacillus zeae]|uniref:General stress protein n=1 Tax=Mesobacillus zeae TaxID=1917180 RepID=A0A398B160_9BACI|nr:general stress protein [Mesobacillus zeae]RID83577.1 general stress protein [Mesobacillus zeae]
MKENLKERLKYLYTGEGFSIILFIFCAYSWYLVFPDMELHTLFSFWLSFFILEFILLQGFLYWYVKYRRLMMTGCSLTPEWLIRLLKTCKRINIILLSVTFIVMLAEFMIAPVSIPGSSIRIVIFIYIFSTAEYINYYHLQLSYDNKSDLKTLFQIKKLKRSPLSKDLARLKES